jgi:hypothetical protein
MAPREAPLTASLRCISLGRGGCSLGRGGVPCSCSYNRISCSSSACARRISSEAIGATLQQSAVRQHYLQLRLQRLEQTCMRVCAHSNSRASVAILPPRIVIVVNPSAAPLTRVRGIGCMRQGQRCLTAGTARTAGNRVLCMLLPIIHAVIVENALLFQLRRERVTVVRVARAHSSGQWRMWHLLRRLQVHR